MRFWGLPDIHGYPVYSCQEPLCCIHWSTLVIESKNSADHARYWVIQSAESNCSNQQRIHVVIPGDICLDTQVGHWIRSRHGHLDHLATEQTNGWAKKAKQIMLE